MQAGDWGEKWELWASVKGRPGSKTRLGPLTP